MKPDLSRREWLAGAGAGVLLARPAWSLASAAPTGRVTVARRKTYGPELVPAMEKMFDELGGLGRMVKGKTVAVNVNLLLVRGEGRGQEGGHVLVAGPGDRRHDPPPGQGGRPPDPGAGRPLVDGRDLGRGHAVDELAAAGYPERRRERGIRKHELPGAREEILAIHGARRRPDLPRLRFEPLV